MASELGKQIGAVGRKDSFVLQPEKITIDQEDPNHPQHTFHMQRVDPGNPAFQRLLVSMREIGWETGSNAYCYFRGSGSEKVAVAATAKRRITAARIVNEEMRKAGRKADDGIVPPYPLLVPMMPTSDHVMAEIVENSNREDDSPIVRAHRFLAAKERMGETRAAAAFGFGSLKDARIAVEALQSEHPELIRMISTKEIPVDLGAKIARKGAAAAAQQLDAARDPVTGKIDPEKLKAAGRKVSKDALAKGKVERAEKAANGKIRPRIMPAAKVVEIKKAINASNLDAKFVALLDFLLGKKNALKDYPSLKDVIDPDT